MVPIQVQALRIDSSGKNITLFDLDIVHGLGGTGLFYKYDSNNNIIGTYNGGGAISCLSDSTLQINNLNITDNKADYGGGILSINDCDLNIENSQFENNEATINGGAIYGYSTDVSVNNATFSNNISDTDPIVLAKEVLFIWALMNSIP